MKNVKPKNAKLLRAACKTGLSLPSGHIRKTTFKAATRQRMNC
jgi:hypothetical protein